MKIKIAFVLVLSVLLVTLVGCNAKESKTLYQSDSIVIVKTGNLTTVSEVLTGNEYNFHTVRQKRSEGEFKPYTAVDNSIVLIEVIGNGLKVYDKVNNTVFTYQRKIRHLRG